jgi:hypothetical protein
MEARDGVSSLGIVVLAPGDLHQQLHLGGLCCDAASGPNAVRSGWEHRLRVRVESEVTTCGCVGVSFLQQQHV